MHALHARPQLVADLVIDALRLARQATSAASWWLAVCCGLRLLWPLPQLDLALPACHACSQLLLRGYSYKGSTPLRGTVQTPVAVVCCKRLGFRPQQATRKDSDAIGWFMFIEGNASLDASLLPLFWLSPSSLVVTIYITITM